MRAGRIYRYPIFHYFKTHIPILATFSSHMFRFPIIENFPISTFALLNSSERRGPELRLKIFIKSIRYWPLFLLIDILLFIPVFRYSTPLLQPMMDFVTMRDFHSTFNMSLLAGFATKIWEERAPRESYSSRKISSGSRKRRRGRKGGRNAVFACDCSKFF